MQPLDPPPRTFREHVEADLRRAARLIIKIQDEPDPQVHVATPDGDYWLAVTLPQDDYERRAAFRRLSTFMIWKRALGFTLASALYDPDSVYCCGISRSGQRHACLSRITREPTPWPAANFGAVEWLPAAAIDPLVIGLLPAAPTPLTPKDVAACDKWFGKSGRFPAVHIPTAEIRGL